MFCQNERSIVGEHEADLQPDSRIQHSCGGCWYYIPRHSLTKDANALSFSNLELGYWEPTPSLKLERWGWDQLCHPRQTEALKQPHKRDRALERDTSMSMVF